MSNFTVITKIFYKMKRKTYKIVMVLNRSKTDSEIQSKTLPAKRYMTPVTSTAEI